MVAQYDQQHVVSNNPTKFKENPYTYLAVSEELHSQNVMDISISMSPSVLQHCYILVIIF